MSMVTRSVIVLACLVTLAFLVLYWRAIIFVSMSLLVVALYNPLVLVSIIVASVAGAVWWMLKHERASS
jgi:hypothetical protein